MEIYGFIGALTAAVFWGSQFVPYLIAKEKPFVAQYQWMTTIGIFIFALIAVPIFKLNYSINLAGIIGGFLWAFGNFFATKALEKLGQAKSFPIYASIIVLLSFFIGILFFGDILRNASFGIIGCIIIILGIYLVSRGYEAFKSKAAFLGVIFAIATGILFGVQLVPLKIAGLTAREFFFPMSLGILIMGTIIFLLHRKKPENKAISNGLIGGVLFNIGNLGSIFSVTYLGLAIGFPLTQLTIVIAVLWGVLVFKEIKDRNKKIFVFLGSIIMVLGAALLGFSK